MTKGGGITATGFLSKRDSSSLGSNTNNNSNNNDAATSKSHAGTRQQPQQQRTRRRPLKQAGPTNNKCSLSTLLVATLVCLFALSLILTQRASSQILQKAGLSVLEDASISSFLSFTKKNNQTLFFSSSSFLGSGDNSLDNQQPRDSGLLRGREAGVSSIKKTRDEMSPAEMYHEAHYIDDAPDWKAFDHVYEDDRVRDLVQKRVHFEPWKTDALFAPSSSSNSLLLMKNQSVANDVSPGQNARHPVFTALRTLDSTRSFFNPICHRYKFPRLDLFPTLSVICPMQYERVGLLSLTVHSLLARTPPELLKEIIIVDDNGNSEERKGEVGDETEIEKLVELHPQKVKYIRNPQRLGCAGSRLVAIRQATGEVIVVLDSHVEMYSSTWAQHLLLPILENPRTLAMQTLDILDDRPGHGRNAAGALQHYGFVNDRFLFSYVSDRFGPDAASKEVPPKREPFEIPFAPGSLFAIRREEFWRLGGYDQGLAVWGGENTELVMKVWRCGFDDPSQPPGRVVVVPCSRVGHVYRIHIKETGHWPPKVPRYVQKKYGIDQPGKWMYHNAKCDLFTRLVTRNNLRIFRVWMGQNSSAMRKFYHRGFGVNSTNPNDLPPEWGKMVAAMDHDPDILYQEEIRDRNKCKDFDWFDRHVVYRLVGRHNPFFGEAEQEVSCGQHFAPTCGACPQGNGALWCNGQCKWCTHGSASEAQVKWRHGHENGTFAWVMDEKSQCVPKDHACRALRPNPPPNPPAVAAAAGGGSRIFRRRDRPFWNQSHLAVKQALRLP